jgi:hypothetical protein
LTRGGPVQTEPHIFPIYWGSNWTIGGALERSFIEGLYSQISGSSWEGIVTQYWGPNGFPSTTVTHEPFVDKSISAPTGVNMPKLEEEVNHAIKVNVESKTWPEPSINSQYVVLTPPGTTYSLESPTYCGFHQVIGSEKVWTFIPWGGKEEGNPFANCSMTIVAAHEFAESVTDPLINAWRGAFPEIEEIADVCGSEERGFIGETEVPSLWDKSAGSSGKCSTSHANPPQTPPGITTEAPTEISRTAATLKGTFEPNGLVANDTYFQWGPTTSYGHSTSLESWSHGQSKASVTRSVTELAPETTYHYRLVTLNTSFPETQTYGTDREFQTPDRPNVATKPATGIGETGVTLNATVNPEGLEAKYWFEYGPTVAYGTKTAETSAGSGSSAVEVSKAVSGLKGGVKYHFRIVASDSERTRYGQDEVVETDAVTNGNLTAMKLTDPFNETTSAVSNFGSSWSALGWSGGTTPKGLDRTTGWGPFDAYSTVNGAYFQPIVTDAGSGIADQVTMSTNPGSTNSYFSLWLDMPTPGSTKAGYQLSFTNTATNTYKVALSRWKEGTQTTLATKEGYSFVNGNSLALLDQGSTVAAWTNTGSGFALLLSASDSTFSGGTAGVEGSGNSTRLTNFKVGSLLKSVSNMDGALKALPVNDALNRTEAPLSNGGAWAALSWDSALAGEGKTGRVQENGWSSYSFSSGLNGAYWQKASFADTGGGDAVAMTLGVVGGFDLWLDAPSPGTTRSGYELRFAKELIGSKYEIALSKWVAGTRTVLTSSTHNALAEGTKYALVDRAGTVSAWANTGGEYSQILSSSDSTYTSGYSAFDGSSTSERLKEFRSGPLAPF